MNAAVFVDFENLYLSLQNRSDFSGLRIRELSLQILGGLLARLRDEDSPMVLGRSYAAFDTYPGVEVAHDLALMGLDPQYVLVSHTGKNSADVQLALDVARVVFRRPDIPQIVIVSGDRDFIPLARQVLEEGRELRVVAIPATTSGDLRERVGNDRFWNALDLLPERPAPAAADETETECVAVPGPAEVSAPRSIPGTDGERADVRRPTTIPRPAGDGAVIVGHIPVTWETGDHSAVQHEERLAQCLDLLMRSRMRHGSKDIWLSPFLKGAMSQHFSSIVHAERRAIINELRNRGIIRVEERENAYADHPYSVIVIQDEHPAAQAARLRLQSSRA
jgi:uncharacterized LabA/DUF88 family protein